MIYHNGVIGVICKTKPTTGINILTIGQVIFVDITCHPIQIEYDSTS